MGVIVGSATEVYLVNRQTNSSPVNDGIQSINWSVQVQPNRLWQLGSWVPYRTQLVTTYSCSVTTYAGVIDPYTLQQAQGCIDSDIKMQVYVDAANCGNTPADLARFGPIDMYVMSYSYSKGDPIGYGTESWSLQTWVDSAVDSADPQFINTPAPSAVIQGITEGNYSGDVTNVGVVPLVVYNATGSQGSIQAGNMRMGSADYLVNCIISRIGGGALGNLLEDQGRTGNSQANIPHTPLYIRI